MTGRARVGSRAAGPWILAILSSLVASGAVVAQDAPPPGAALPDPEVFETAGPSDDPVLEAQVRRVASQLRCPTCQAESVADSPGEISREMTGVIRDLLQEGRTPAEVKAHFVSAYGQWILLSPEPRGFNLTVYVLPWVGLLAGGAVLFHVVRSRLAPEGDGDGSADPASEEQ